MVAEVQEPSRPTDTISKQNKIPQDIEKFKIFVNLFKIKLLYVNINNTFSEQHKTKKGLLSHLCKLPHVWPGTQLDTLCVYFTYCHMLSGLNSMGKTQPKKSGMQWVFKQLFQIMGVRQFSLMFIGWFVAFYLLRQGLTTDFRLALKSQSSCRSLWDCRHEATTLRILGT